MPGSSTEAVHPAESSVPRREPRVKAALALTAAFIGLSLLWNLPVAYSEFGWPWLRAAALEVTLAFALLALVPWLRTGWPGQLAASLMALATTLVVASKIAELTMRESLARPFNPLLDVHLAKSLVHLLTETLGGLLGWLCIAGLALLPFLVFAGAWTALRVTQRALTRPFARHAMLAASAVLISLFAVQQMAPQALSPHRLVSDHASATLLRQWRLAAQVQASLEAFQGAIAQDRFRTVPADRLLARLDGADVLLMFIEFVRPQRPGAAILRPDAGANARSLRRAPRRARPPRRLRLAHLAHGRRPVVARARHARERPVASGSGALRGAAAQRATHPHPRVCPRRLSHGGAQAGDHPALARGRASGLRPDLRRGRSGLRRQAVQLGHHARSVHACRLRAQGACRREAVPCSPKSR